MSQLVKSDRDFHELLKVRDKAFVLFYASWCLFSLRFLPIFEQQAKAQDQDFIRVIIDHEESLCEKYSVAVYPTVLFFENGKVSRRLDGISGVGLDEKKLKDLIKTCRA
jgi:thiol-disulfide isomerase/thioredoxin